MKLNTITLLALCSIPMFATQQEEALVYINQLRGGVGLIPYSLDAKLNQAAQNHSDYMQINNILDHPEDSSKKGYTGASSDARIKATGYDWTTVSENISYNNSDINNSIDGLFVSIYHRLGFLSTNTEQLGVGVSANGKYYTYNMATKKPNYASDIRDLNPKIIKWPYDNYKNAQPVFFNNESPDPLPECKDLGPSGNPISIEFNANKSGGISISSFELKNANGEVVPTKRVTYKLSNKQFVIFPINRLDWDSNYTAIFSYTEDDTAKSESWSFKTITPKHVIYTLEDTAKVYDIAKNSTYTLYAKPIDCNDAGGRYSVLNNLTFIDKNTYNYQVNAPVGSDLSLTISDKEFNFHVFTQEITDLEFIDKTSSSVTLKWTHEKSGEETGYKIYRDDKFLALVTSDKDTYTDNTLSPSTTYTYTVKVTND